MKAEIEKRPEWLRLINRVKSIVEIGAGSRKELTDYVGVDVARYFEWVNRRTEPKAQPTLKILAWVTEKESKINADPVFAEAYARAVKNQRKS